MSTYSTPDCIRVTCRFKDTNAGDIVNVYHFRIMNIGPFTADEVMDDMEQRIDDLYTTMAGNLGGSTDPYDIRFDKVELAGGVEVLIETLGTRTWTLSSPPAATGDKLPTANAAIVNLRTAYPRVFGRKYLGSIAESAQADGTLVGTAMTALGNYLTELLTDYIGTTVNFESGVLSLKAGPGSAYWAPLIGGVVNSLLGTQRRRRKNRGS